MGRTIRDHQEASQWQTRHESSAPSAGEPAPDFELWDSEGQRRVRLRDSKGRTPVALIFGSFT